MSDIKLRVSIILLTTLLIGGCSNTDISNTDISNTDISNTEQNEINSMSSDEYKKEIESDIKAFLRCEKAEKLNTFEDGVEIQPEDASGITDGSYIYYTNSSIYFQIGSYMYRFQLNRNKKIVSYIKYNLYA